MRVDVLQESRGQAATVDNGSAYNMTLREDSAATKHDKLRLNTACPMLNKELLDVPVIGEELVDTTMVKQEAAATELLKPLTDEVESQMFTDLSRNVARRTYEIQRTSQEYGKSRRAEQVSNLSDRLVAGVPVTDANYQSPASSFRMARKNRRDVRSPGVWNHVPVLNQGRSAISQPMLKRSTDRFSSELASTQAQLTRSDFDVPLTLPATLNKKKDRVEIGAEAFRMAQSMNVPDLEGTVERMPFVSLSRRN